VVSSRFIAVPGKDPMDIRKTLQLALGALEVERGRITRQIVARRGVIEEGTCALRHDRPLG